MEMIDNDKDKNKNLKGSALSATDDVFIRQMEQAEAGVSDSDNPEAVDLVKSYISTLQANPEGNITPQDMLFDYKNIEGIEINGKKKGLLWTMNASNDYYKAMYPNLTDDMLDGMRELYTGWQSVYNTGEIGNYATGNADGKNLSHVIHSMHGMNTISNVKFTHNVNPNTSAQMKDYYLDAEGNIQPGSPAISGFAPSGKSGYSYPLTVLQQDPYGDGYVYRVIDTKDKTTHGLATTMPIGGEMFIYRPRQTASRLLEKGKYFTYVDSDGVEKEVKSIIIDENGNRYTTNRFLGGQKEYDDYDFKEALDLRDVLEKQFSGSYGDLGADTFTVWSDKDAISVKQHKQPTYYKDRNSFMSWVGHSFKESYFDMHAWIGNMIFDNKKWDDIYYENLMRKYQNPVGIPSTTESSYYNRNIAKMTGDLLAQMLPSIITAGITGGISGGGIILKGVQATAKGAAKTTVKATVKATAKKQAVNQGVRSEVFLGREGGMLMVKQPLKQTVIKQHGKRWLRTASWSVPAAGQSGFGTYREGLESGVVDHDAAGISLLAAAITLGTSRLLEPTWIRSGMFVKLDKNAVNSTVNNLVTKMGLQVATKEGRSKFVRNGITELLKKVQGKGVGAWSLELGLNAFMEGAQEYVEGTMVGWTQMIYNKYNRGDYSKRVGEGLYDVDGFFSADSSEFILGSLMGFGASVIPSMTTLGSAIRYSKEKRAKDDNYMLYSLFAAKGTDKVVKEFQSNILQRRANGQLGSTNHDINGNQIKMDANGNPIGETMDISDSPFAAVLGDTLRTEADMNAYNMLMEGLREAEIFDYIKGTKISQDVDSDLLISADVKNNMAVEAALAYKNVKQKRERIEAIQESLNDPNLKSEEKDKLTDELDTLTATDLRNDNTLAYWENKLDHWSKPLDTVEYDGKVLTGYKYSEGIRRSIINTSFAADKYIITKAYQLGMDVDENIAGSKGFAELFANSDRFLNVLHAYNEYFGRVEPNSINVKTGKPVYNGLSGLFKAFNDRVGQIHSQETKDAADTLKNALKGKLVNINELIKKRRKGEIDIVSLQQAVNDELKDIFGGESLESVGKQLGWTYDGFSEALSNNMRGITSALGDIDSLNEAMKDTEVDDMLQEYFTIRDAISKNVTNAFQGIDSYVTEGRLEAEELTVETIEADSVQSTDDKQKLDKLFEEIKNKAISGIMLYEIAPLEDIPLMFRNYSLADLINFVDANKTSPMDMNTMLALDKAINIYKAHMNNIGMYLWGLETLKATADTNQMLKEGHTYDNQITRRFIDARADIESKLKDDHEKISLMYENMKKNGFSKLKEELRYQAAHLSNTNMYMTDTLYHTAIPYLTRFFDVKNGVVSLPDNLPDGTVESFLKKRIELYLEKKYPNEKERKAKLQEILKAMDDNIQDVKKVLDAYFNAVQDLMNKWYGTPQQSGNSGTVNLHDPNAVNIMLERLFSDTSQNQEKAIADFTAMMNEMYVLQWKYREQLSGKMTPFLLWTEAVAEHNKLAYRRLNEHKGTKLYIPEDSTTTGNDIVYRGTFAPGDLQLGKSMLFDTVNDIQRGDYNELVNIATTRMLMTPEELKNYDNTKTEALRDALLDKIENSKVNRDTALHYIITNMGIDNFMGGNNMTVMQCLGHIKQNVIDSLIDRMQLNGRKLSDSVAKKVRKAIVIKDGIMDEEATMKSLLDVLEDIKDIDDLGATAKMIYSSLNTAITLEQEYAVIHLVSSFYRHSDGNNMLGVPMEDKDVATLLDKSVAVLGAGGTGKSTMVLENYYYVTKQILTKERKTDNGKVIPAKKKVKILVASPTHAVNNIQEANIKKVYGDEADIVKITFHDMRRMNLNDIDIVVIDEASLINNQKDKNTAKKDKQYSDYGVLMDMVRRVNPQHVVAIYDTNQTANMGSYSAPEITTMLGERTIPLQMRHRTGYVDLNVLSNIFSDDAYAVQCAANNGLVPLTRNGVPFNAKWKKDVKGNKKGVRITGNVSDVIQDYLDAKKTNSDGNMIIVRMAEDKANLLSKYENLGVVPEDVYILEYGDKDFNVSGRNSRNVFVIVDDKYIDKAAPVLKSYLYRLHAKMLNTAITRLRGDGYVSLYYPNGDVHSTEVEANDILLQYKNTLDVDYVVDTKEIINEFGSMAVTALRLQNNSYIRMTDPEQVAQQQATQQQAVNQQTPQSTTQDIQQVYEDISDTMADVIEEVRSEEAIDGAKPISDKVYENISGTDEVAMNVNNIVREGLKIIYRKVQEGVLNISKFNVQPNTADFDKVYGDIIKAIAKHYATQGINMGNYTEKDILYIIHNVVLNSISDTGIQVMADMNKYTAIISPNLNVNIGGTDYVATPFMVNVVGYETNADKTLTPIFDVYELDISQSPRNNVDEVAEGNKKKAAYAIAILAAKGYKVNKVHFLNFVLTPGKRVTTTFNNRFTTDDTTFVFDGKSYESIYSSIKSEQGEEVKAEDIFADKDALLKLGVIMPLEDAERNSRYQNLKTKNVSYIVGKELKMVMGDKVVYYHLANGDVLTDVEFGHTYQRVENKEKKQYNFGATKQGHIRTPLNAIPAIAVQGQNLPQSRVEFYDHPFFKKLRGDGAYKLKGKEVKAEYHEELSFFQWDSKTESTKSVTYYNVVLYKDGDEIVGVQERLRFSNNTEATRKQLDAMVAKYVKTKNEKEANDILNDIERWLMDCEKQYSEDHSFDDSNVAYQIDKIKNIRKVAFKQGNYVVGDVSNGTHIISEVAYPLQELVDRRVNKGESIVDWEQADSDRFSVITTFMIDGQKVDIHCDAAKVDDSYIANMKAMAKDFRKRYNKILKGDEAAIGNDIARLAMEMQASELTDFLYANRERLEKANLYDFSKNFIDFKLDNKKAKGGKVNVKNTMANMLNQIDLAIKIADNSRKGALDMAWNKAIFMTNVLAASNETLYLNNLVSKVIDVSTPTLEITDKGAGSKPPVGGASNVSPVATPTPTPAATNTANQVKGDPFLNNDEGNGFSGFRISKEGEAVDMSTDDDVRAATAEVQRIVGDSFASNNLKFNERMIEEGISREVFGKLSDNIITLSYRSGSLMPAIARHEAMHFVLYFCLSPDEYDRVMSAQRAILMREHKTRDEGTVPTDTDVLEAICEGFENYKYKTSTKPKNLLERLYYALKRFFERFMRNRRTIEKLYSRADSGFYANEALHKYNNNLLREDRYAIARGSLSNEYNSYEAVTELSNFYGGKINIIDNVLDTQRKIILNRSIETGKIVLKPKDSYREVASVYLNLISEANFEEIDGLVISYNVVEDGVTVEKELTLKELLYNNNELDVAMFTELTTNPNIKSDIGNADLIRRLAGDITGHIYSNPKLALATLAFHYPMMERAYKGNNDMVNIYMQMLDPFIDMREMISDTERLVKQKEKHGKKIDHKMLTSSQTFNKPSGVNDHTNYKFKDMIENITYRKGKFMSNVSFSEFSSIIKKCNLIFTEDINNKFKDKIVLGYDDIMALIKSQINDGTNSKYTTQAIYSHFSNEAPKGYDKNNEESMNTFFYNEWSDNYQGFNFNNYGYGFMLQRINDYLEEGSISNKLLKDATGNFYNQVEAMLIEKRVAITANVINTFVNYFNSMDVVNSHVANVDNTIVSMTNFTSSSTNKMIGDIAYNNMFEEHNETYGFTDRAKKLKKEYKINGYKDTITYKYTNSDGAVVQGKINTKLQEFSVEDVQAIERLLVAVYDNYIVSENIYNPSLQNEGKYRVSRKAVNTAIQVIDMLHTFNPALGVKPEIPLSYVSSLNQGIEVILSGTSKNAEGENVSNIKVKTPLTLVLNNSGKIASLSQDMTMYNPDAVVMEQLVKEATEYTFDDTVELEDGDIEDIIDMMIDDETLIYTDENNNPCVPTVPKAEEGMRGNDFTKGSKWTMIEEFDGATHSEGGIDIKLTDRGFTFAREDGDVLAENGLLIAKGKEYVNAPDYESMSKVLTERNKHLNWVERGLNPDKYPKIQNEDGSYSTHKLAYSTGDKGEAYIYPMIIQNENGELVEFKDSKEAMDYAIKTNTVMVVPNVKLAEYYSSNGLIKH